MLEVGLKGSFKVKVTDENTAKTMKSGDLDVFATPSLVAALEAASVDADQMPAAASYPEDLR